MTSLQFLSQLIQQYGVYAVFFLVMIEGDITLLLAGVLAHSAFFGDSALGQLRARAAVGNAGRRGQRQSRLSRGARVRQDGAQLSFLSQLAKRGCSGLRIASARLSIFLSKYIYGLRWASCTFYGVAHMPYVRFLLLSLASCFVWVLILSGIGFFFSTRRHGIARRFSPTGQSACW